MVEPIDIVKTRLRTSWLIANTTDRKPLIEDIDEVNNPQVTDNQEYILLYEATNTDEYPGLNQKWKDQDWTISCVVRAGTKAQMKLIDDEIVRIHDAYNTNVGNGISWWKTNGRKITIQDKNKPLYELRRDISLNKQSTVI